MNIKNLTASGVRNIVVLLIAAIVIFSAFQAHSNESLVTARNTDRERQLDQVIEQQARVITILEGRKVCVTTR